MIIKVLKKIFNFAKVGAYGLFAFYVFIDYIWKSGEGISPVAITTLSHNLITTTVVIALLEMFGNLVDLFDI